MKRLFAFGVSVCFFTAMFFPAGAEAAQGWLVGTGLGVAKTYSSQENIKDLNMGMGTCLDIGYGFNKNFMVGAYMGANLTQSASSSNELDAKFILPWGIPYLGAYGRFTFDVGKGLEPYADVGLGAYWETLGLKAGGGLNWFPGSSGWFLGPELAFHYIPKYEDSVFEGLFKFGYQWKK
jgi:hypothetical protein